MSDKTKHNGRTTTKGSMRKDETFGLFVKRRLNGGVLRRGPHEPNGDACALEARSQALGIDWTDSPVLVDFPDIRPINDAAWDNDNQRTAHMVPVMEALWNWPSWNIARRITFVERLVKRINEEMPRSKLRHLASNSVYTCEIELRDYAKMWAANGVGKAEIALRLTAMVFRVASSVAIRVARASRLPYAVGSTTPSELLILACRIWRECAEESVAAEGVREDGGRA